MPDRTSDLWWFFSRQTVCVTRRETVLHAALIMHKRNFRHLPIITELGKIEGIISAQDVIDSLNLVLQTNSSQEVIKSLEITVNKIMALHPIVVEPGDGLSEVIRKISYHNIGALPVVNEQGFIQGIVTLRDIVDLMGISSEPLGVRVSEVMNSNVVTIQPDSSLSQAIRLMSESRVRRLPILSRKNEILGMLTNRDVLKHLTRIVSGEGPKFDRPISEFMTREVIGVGENDDIRVAASRMKIFGVGGLSVTSPAIALITERDLVRKSIQIRSVNFLVSAIQFQPEVDHARAF